MTKFLHSCLVSPKKHPLSQASVKCQQTLLIKKFLTQYDVAIIGGRYAGLYAVLPLAPALRSVVVIDHGQRRNRFALHSHGFLTQDGTLASEIAEIAREQIALYPTVKFETGQVLDVAKSNDLFHVCIDKMHAITAKGIIIATGVTDQLPDIKGLRVRWGQSIFH